MAASTTSTTSLSMTSGEAPVYSTDTETTGGSMSGFSRTASCRKEATPKTTIRRLRTVARTGRLIETSERIICGRLHADSLRIDDLDLRAVAQVLQTQGRHHFAGGQSFSYLHLAMQTLADHHRPALGASACDHEDIGTTPFAHHGGFRNQDGIAFFAHLQADAHEHARSEPAICVLQLGLNSQRARHRIDARVDARHAPLEGGSRKGRADRAYGQARLHAAQKALGHGKVEA